MRDKPPPGLFITGVNTGVGKTYVAALIARQLVAAGYRVGVYKPVASGCPLDDNGQPIAEDAVALWQAAGKPATLEQVCPQRFIAPLAPPLAAHAEDRVVDPELLRRGLEPWLADSDIILVEGAGGLMSPLSDEDYVADLAYDLGYPLVVVAANELGVINQTLQTLITASAFRTGLPIAGVVLNDIRAVNTAADPSTETNADELQARCIPPLLAHVPWQAKEFVELVDWYQLAAEP